jgi:starch phosphorylase
VLDLGLGLGRRSLDKDGLKKAILGKLVYSVGKDPAHATPHDWLFATALACRDRMVDGWMAATRQTYAQDERRVYYLSLEFLIGRLLGDSLRNLGILEPATEALAELGADPAAVLEAEPDAALGNGGLGRLAACFLDSMASLGIAAYGYGIRYEHGLFRQGLDQGWQAEQPESWLAFGNPWEFERAEVAYPIRLFGTVRETQGPRGERRQVWDGGERVLAVAFDTPVVGWRGRRINTLRLWSAKSPSLIDLESFNRGDYMRAVAEQVQAESISRILYPNDATEAGQELRLKQEYFFTSASLQDILRRHLSHHSDVGSLPDKVAIQLNDTHPALAVPELMRLLIDEHGLGWARAWEITRGVIHYTNHTLMPEALERWPVHLLERLLPRHLRLIYDINAAILAELRGRPEVGDPFLADVSLIEEGWGRAVRMGHLAFVGSRKVNGVSALHTELMKQTVFKSLHRHFPGRIVNKTNGITPRRWLLGCNPGLAGLLREAIGDAWLDDLEGLAAVAPLAEDAAFRERFAAVRRGNKARLAELVHGQAGLRLDPTALLDVQIKRIHEYKRQLLNVLETVALHAAIRDAPAGPWVPRVKLFSGKAASGYVRAKLIIKLINDVAAMVNGDSLVGERLKVVFLANYNVSLAQAIIPAADLSEQISTAGMEASGTGNMKLALNGALTIGTLDGANVEIRERVGPESFFLFGLAAEEVALRRRQGRDPQAAIAACPALARALELIESGAYSPDDPGRFRPLVDELRSIDHFLLTDDFASYERTQREIDAAFGAPHGWWRMAVRNTAMMGHFSSDRTIREYADEIWRVPLGR